MKVSQRTEYGIRAMISLARHYDDGPASIKEIATGEGIPGAFLEQIMAELRRGGIVESQRGVNGGYMLSKSPNETSVGTVVEILEGSLSPARCESDCSKMPDCSTRTVLKKIEESITKTLDNIYLDELLKVGVHEE